MNLSTVKWAQWDKTQSRETEIESRSTHVWKRNFEGENEPEQAMPDGSYIQSNSPGAEPVHCGCQLGCILHGVHIGAIW